MRKLLPSRAVLLLALVSSVALARDRDSVAARTLLLSGNPRQAAHPVYMKGQVVTVLRFEQPCDPARTKLLGGEGLFEPVGVIGKKVVLELSRDLADEEGVSLIVTLADGTEVPFLVRPPKREEWGWTDQQVNVFKDRHSYDAMSSALKDAREENAALREEVESFRQEETSEDHALAALLASGAVKQTPFKVAKVFSDQDADAKVVATVFRGKGKAAVVFDIKNLDSKQTWGLKMARLVTMPSGFERPVAVRSTRTSISPGTAGVIAFVVDKSAFVEEGALTDLLLEIYRQDGLQQAFVQLDHHLTQE